MSLFKKKKLTLDEILESLSNLTDEEKASLKDKLDNLYKAEDEREIDKIEEDKADDATEADEKAEEKDEESEEIGKDVDELEEEAEADEESEPEEESEEATEEPEAEEPTPEQTADEEAETEEHHADTKELYTMLAELKKSVEALAARINAEEANEEEDPFKEFGIAPGDFGKEAEDEGDVEKMKSKYWNL